MLCANKNITYICSLQIKQLGIQSDILSKLRFYYVGNNLLFNAKISFVPVKSAFELLFDLNDLSHRLEATMLFQAPPYLRNRGKLLLNRK